MVVPAVARMALEREPANDLAEGTWPDMFLISSSKPPFPLKEWFEGVGALLGWTGMLARPKPQQMMAHDCSVAVESVKQTTHGEHSGKLVWQNYARTRLKI